MTWKRISQWILFVFGERNLIRNKRAQTEVTSTKLNKSRTKTAIFFTNLTLRMSQHTCSEVTVSLKG